MKQIVERLRSEFLEMPGLQLTTTQAERLCGISPSVCRDALDALVDAKFLCVKSNGCYARLTEGQLGPNEQVVRLTVLL